MPNLITINDDIGWGNSAPWYIKSKLDEFAGEDVTVHMNSPGGGIVKGLEVFHSFLNYPGHVHMHVVSLAASMASVVILAGNKITAERSHIIMIHNAQGCICGDNREIQEYADFLKSMNIMLANIISKRTKMELKEVEKLMNKETFFFGDDSLKAGLIDEIVELEERNTPIDNKDDSIAYAKIRIEDCNAKIKADSKEEDFKEVAALMKFENKKTLDKKEDMATKNSNGINPANAGQQNKREVSSMLTLEELKTQNPGLYNKIFEEGVQAGKKEFSININSHMKWFKDSPKEVAAAILAGEEFTMEHMSAYSNAAINNRDATDREEDDPDSVNTPEVDEDAAEKKIMARVNSGLNLEEVN